MKKHMLSVLLTVLVSMFLLAGCGNSAEQETTGTSAASAEETQMEEQPKEQEDISEDEASDSNILIVYFSRVGITDLSGEEDAVSSASINKNGNDYIGNAAILANMAAEQTGGDLFQIITEENYPTGYRDTTDQASTEKEENARPALASHVENMEQYQFIFLIYPNWWGDMPMPLYTFLEAYDFSGKTIAPLATHEGSGLGSSIGSIENLVGNDTTIVEGLAVRGSDVSDAQSDIENWINGMELPEPASEEQIASRIPVTE